MCGLELRPGSYRGPRVSAARPENPIAAGGDCNLCCGGCTKKTPTDAAAVGYDFSTDPSLAAGECVCFEGALSGTSNSNRQFVTLTGPNDCAKVNGDFVEIKARARRPCRARSYVMVAFRAGRRGQQRDCCRGQQQRCSR